MRFLIVEDDPSSQTTLRGVLKPYARCDLADNGAEAVQAFRQAHADGLPYDLIMMDIMMPVMNGQQALVEIREHERLLGIASEHQVRVVVLSALSDPMNVVDAYYKGRADSYLVKPVDRGLLLEVIRNAGVQIEP